MKEGRRRGNWNKTNEKGVTINITYHMSKHTPVIREALIFPVWRTWGPRHRSISGPHLQQSINHHNSQDLDVQHRAHHTYSCFCATNQQLAQAIYQLFLPNHGYYLAMQGHASICIVPIHNMRASSFPEPCNPYQAETGAIFNNGGKISNMRGVISAFAHW